MSDETTLLPCPFCGGEAHISDDYSSKRGMVYSVWHDCPAGGGYHPYGQGVGVLQVTSAWFSSREEAIAAWNTRATHGTLTAKQVSKATYAHSIHADCADADWQAIADELNAELGSRTCELEPLSALDVTLNMLDQTEWGVCSECGRAVPMDAKFCNECGKAVS